MNLIVGFVILLCLCGSTGQTDSQPHDVMLQMVGIGITAIAVPGLAFVQTILAKRRMAVQPLSSSDFDLIQNRIGACHTAVWLTASIGIIWAFHWHDFVQQTLGLEHWVLIDEILILAPAILALVASWAIFYDIEPAHQVASNIDDFDQRQTLDRKKKSGASRSWLRFTKSSRYHFVSIRFGVHVAVMLVPILCAIAAKDVLLLLDSLSPSIAYPLFVGLLFALLLLFPLMIRVAWNTSPTAPNLQLGIRQELTEQGVRVHAIRIWNTQDQIINACVVGFLPWLRQILISDRLVQLFTESEVQAIVRHEAAHLRRQHALTRITTILLPPALWMSWCQLFHHQPLTIFPMAERFDVSPFAACSCLAILYGIYLVCLQRYLGHMAEYEADLLACCVAPNEKPSPSEKRSPKINRYSVCPVNQASMLEALLRLGACIPQHVDRASLIHPSIRRRIEAIQSLVTNREKHEPSRDTQVSVHAIFRQNNLALASICGVAALVTAALAC
jgi:STE24 endopeptidase